MAINEKNFLYNLGDMRKKAFAFLAVEMEQIGLNDVPPSYGDILFVLKNRPGSSINDLSKMTNKDKSTVSLIINDLERKGYVTKEKNEIDGRAVSIKLSEKAAKYADQVMAISRKLRHRIFSSMTDEEKEIFFILLNKLAANL